MDAERRAEYGRNLVLRQAAQGSRRNGNEGNRGHSITHVWHTMFTGPFREEVIVLISPPWQRRRQGRFGQLPRGSIRMLIEPPLTARGRSGSEPDPLPLRGCPPW